MTPICIECTCEMRCEKSGQLVNDVRAANFPSTYWRGDVWECPICHHQIAVGFGAEIAEESVPEQMRSQSITFANHPLQKFTYANQFSSAPIRVDCYEGVQPK